MPETPLSHRFIPDLNSMIPSSTALSNISSTNLNPANSSTNLSPANITTNPNPANSSINLSPLNDIISLYPMNQLPMRLPRLRSHCPHLSLSPRRHEVVDVLPPPPPPPPLTLEDLATDSDS